MACLVANGISLVATEIKHIVVSVVHRDKDLFSSPHVSC